jgi:hypothetical protein
LETTNVFSANGLGICEDGHSLISRSTSIDENPFAH